MNCFHHENHVAVANCRQCSKGLCKDCCYFDTNQGVFCSDVCFERLKQLDHMNATAIEAYKLNPRVFLNAGKYQRLMALFLTAVGAILVQSGWEIGWDSDVYKMGAVVAIFGVILLGMHFWKTKT